MNNLVLSIKISEIALEIRRSFKSASSIGHSTWINNNVTLFLDYRLHTDTVVAGSRPSKEFNHLSLEKIWWALAQVNISSIGSKHILHPSNLCK